MKLWMAISVTAVILAVGILPSARRGGDSLSGGEMVAIRDLLTVGGAESQYLSRFGKYAATLAELELPVSGYGYLFTLALTPAGYKVNANPKNYGGAGRRTFYLDQNGTVHQNWSSDPATANSSEFK